LASGAGVQLLPERFRKQKGNYYEKIVVATHDEAEIFAELPCFAHVIAVPEQ